VSDLRAHLDQVDIKRAHQIEAETRHDLMAELRTFAEHACRRADFCTWRYLDRHRGQRGCLALRAALDLDIGPIGDVLDSLAAQIYRWAETPPWPSLTCNRPSRTTVGYRLAQYGQDCCRPGGTARRRGTPFGERF